MTEPDRRVEQLQADFQRSLDAHGYGFQFAVLKAAEDAWKADRSPWRYEVAEYPIGEGSAGTRIDFLLRHEHARAYLVAECKRANPALADWCFFRAPRSGRYVERGYFLVDVVRLLEPGAGPVEATAEAASAIVPDPLVFHQGIELRSGAAGEPRDRGRGAIEEAATQLARSVAGLAHSVARYRRQRTVESWLFFPVLFTTARLWGSPVDLGSADLLTGALPAASAKLQPLEYLFLQFPISPALRHSIPVPKAPLSPIVLLGSDFCLTIAVVSDAAVEKFLQHGSSSFAHAERLIIRDDWD
jgi:hypothetical protein